LLKTKEITPVKFLQPLSFYAGIRSKLQALLQVLAKRPKQRASAFLLESLEPRVMLSATPMDVIQASSNAATMSAAVVVTDYPDYGPSETAIITTSNTDGEGLKFSDGELVRFQVTRTDGVPDYLSRPVNGTPAGNAPWYVIDGVGGFAAHQEFDANGEAIDRDANGVADWIAPDNDLVVNGSISTAWYVDLQYLGASLQLTAAGQDSGAIASTTFTDANFNTTTTVTSNNSTTTYGTSVTFTATVRSAATTGSRNPRGSVSFYDGTTLIGTDDTRDSSGNRSGTWSITISNLGAGTHSIRAVYSGGAAGGDTFNASTSASITQTVSKADATVTVTGYTGVFDGAAHGATGTAVGVLGENLSAGLNLGATFTTVPGGTANWTFSGGTNYNDQSGSVAIVITNGSLLTTTTGVTSSALTTTYGTAVTFTARVTAASGSAAPTGTVQFFDGTTSLGIVSAPSTTGTGTATWSITTANLTAGTHTSIRAVYTATGSFAGSASANLTQTVTRKALTGGFTAGNKTYDGTASATVLTRTLTGVLAGDAGAVSLTGGTATFSTAAAGTGKTVTLAGATLTGAAAGNYTLSSVGTTTATIAKADATVTVTGYTSVYGASAGTAVGLLSNSLPVPIQSNGTVLELSAAGITNTSSAGLSGVNGFRYVNTLFPADQEAQVTVAGAPAAGSGHFVFIFLRTQNPNTASLNSYYIAYQENGATGTWLVGRLINNSAQTRAIGSGTLLAAGDQIRADVVGNRVTAYSYHGGVWKTEISFTMTGADVVSGSGYMGLEISGASPEIRLTNMIGGGYTGVFGVPATNRATGTVVGALGESLSGLDLSGTTHTNAGTYTDPWTFTDVTGNYNNASGTVINTIAKADATVTVTGYTGVFDGAAHGATGTAVGVLGENLSAGLNLGATFTTVPGGTANWTFSGGTNYNDQSGSVAIVITNGSLLTTTTGVTSSALTTTYGTAVTFTARVTAASGSAAPTGTVQFFDGTTSLGIVSAPSTTGTGTATWSITTANLTAGTHTSIRAVYTATGSFAGSASANLTQTVTRKALTGGFTAGNKTYDGTASATVLTRTLTGVLAGDAGAVSLTGGTATFSTAAAGTGKTVTLAGATLTGAAAGNYTLSSVGTTTATIAKADATVTVTGYTSVYGASAGTAVGLLSNSLPVPIQSNGTVLELSAAGITNTSSAGLSGVNGFRYVNTLFPADQEAQVTVAGAPAAGSGHFVFIFLRTQNPNTASLNSYYIAYQENGATGTWLVGRLINNSAQTRAIGSGTLLAAGDQIRADVVGNRVTAYSYHGGVWKTEISFTMTGADVVSGSGYMGLEISGASPEIRLTNMIGGGYTGVFGVPATNRATGTVVGALGESLSGLDLSGTTHTNAGTYTDPWTFTDVTGNYNNASGTVINTIAKAKPTVTVTGYNVTYNGAAHQATGKVLGVFGEVLSGLDLSRTTHTNVGAYTDPWTFIDVTGNYENASGTVFNQIVL
jgi:Bacterial Ig-like domain (group 3)/YDG domain